MRHVGQRFLQKEGFIVGPRFSAKAAAQDGDLQALLAIQPADILHAGRLSRSAQRQVADTYNRHIGRMNRPPAPIVKSIPNHDDQAVKPADHIETGPL